MLWWLVTQCADCRSIALSGKQRLLSNNIMALSSSSQRVHTISHLEKPQACAIIVGEAGKVTDKPLSLFPNIRSTVHFKFVRSVNVGN